MAKGKRRSPFKPFGEYTPTVDQVEEWIDGVLVSLPRPMPNPMAQTANSKSLLFTYTLAFQCVVNIGVRGSETIRTRVVEAGALDVVVNVLERYLEEVERRKARFIEVEEWARKDAQPVYTSTTTAVTVRHPNAPPAPQAQPQQQLTRPSLAQLETATFAGPSHSATPSPIHMPHLATAPPARVSTPDTIVTMDGLETETDGDNGSSSGQEQEEEAVVVLLSLSQAQAEEGRQQERERTESKRPAEQVDGDGDVVMGEDDSAQSGPAAHEGGGAELMDSSATSTTPTVATATLPSRQRSNSRRHPHHSHSHSHPHPQPPPPPHSHHAGPPPPPPAHDVGGLQYRDEDVLLSLQLLAYLSKYPHVRSVFHSPAAEAARQAAQAEKQQAGISSSSSTSTTNVFSLVEAFTHRPSSSDTHSPRHSSEVQYWAGVIMRNACRKDESRGGIRQCANMQCGVWEKYAREFAKCRRCRKAKYCSKACQSSAWGKGHRYWCAKAAPKEAGTTAASGAAGEAGEAEVIEGAAGRRSRRHQADDDDDELPQPPNVAHPHHHHHAHAGATLPLDDPRNAGPSPNARHHRHVHAQPPGSGTITPTNIPPPPAPLALGQLGPRLGLGAFGVGGTAELEAGMVGIDEGAVAREMMERGGGDQVVFGLGGQGAGGVAVVGEEM